MYKTFLHLYGIFALLLVTSAAQAQGRVLVLGVSSVEGDDRVAETITSSVRVVWDNRDDWTYSVDANGVMSAVTLDQLLLAHGCEDVDRACLEQIGDLFSEADPELTAIAFARMRRRSAGADEVTIEVILYDVVARRATHRLRLEVTISDLIIRGNVGESVGEWIDQLLADESRFEDTGAPYFTPVPMPGIAAPNHAPLEIAGWSLIGLAGASAIAAMVTGGLTLGMNGDARFDAYRASWEAGSGNVCDFARGDPSPDAQYVLSRCSEAESYEIATPILWTLAALAGIGGAALAWHPWTGSGSSEVSVTFLPTFGRDRGGGSLTITF